MKTLTAIGVSLLISLACAAPVSNTTSVFLLNNYPENWVIYKAEYDIANIYLPVNALNGKKSGDVKTPLIFFVLADDIYGDRVDKGLYVRKNGEVKKILEKGRDITADFAEESDLVVFGAADGLYKYNLEENKADKYGTINDDIINVAKINGTDILYILTKDKIVYKVTEEGTKKEMITEIVNAQEFVLDSANNLYYTSNGQVYIFDSNGVHKINGLPEKGSRIKLIRPPIDYNGTAVVIDGDIYSIFPNQTSVFNKKYTESPPTAYSFEGMVLLYFGSNKKIYEVNLLLIIFDGIFNGIKNKIRETFGIS